MPGLYTIARHGPAQCAGHACPFHNPSDHHMAQWPRVVLPSGLTVRICEHGVPHPDPDSLAWIGRVVGTSLALSLGIHGCCETLCCVGQSGFVH